MSKHFALILLFVNLPSISAMTLSAILIVNGHTEWAGWFFVLSILFHHWVGSVGQAKT